MLRELGLVQQQNNKGSQLSGGQKKRTSTALELLTKPSLLFLDEPTSGLDPDLDHEVMQLLRGLADDGRTVVCVTHSTLNLHLCDLVLVLAEGGHLAYLGTPQGALDYFGAQSYSEMFSRLKSRPAAGVGAAVPRLARSTRGTSWAAARASGPTRRTDLPPLRQQTRLSQFSTLCRRYLAVIAADKAYLGILLLLPILLAGISRVVPAEFGLGLGADDKANLQGSAAAAGARPRVDADGLGQRGPRDRQGTRDLPARTVHRAVQRRLSVVEAASCSASSPRCRRSC